MKSLAIFFVAVCVVSASAFKMSSQSGIAVPVTYKNELLEQVFAQLEAGGPLSNVFEFFDKLVGEINAEQAEHDKIHKKQVAECKVEQVFRTSEIKEANIAFGAAKNHRELCSESLVKAHAELDKNTKDQESTHRTLNNARRVRKAQNTLYKKRMVDHANAIKGVDDTVDFLASLVEAPQLVELSHHATNMLTTGARIGMSAHYAQGISALIALSSDKIFANQDIVKRINAALADLRAKLVASEEDYTKTENQQQAEFDQLEKELLARIDDLENEEELLREHIAEMDKCLVEEKAVMESATNKRVRNTKLLAHSVKMCEDAETEWKNASANRAKQLSVIGDVRKIVEKQTGKFSAHVEHRADVDEFKVYKDKTAFKAVKKFDEEGGEFNAAGAKGAGFKRVQKLEGLF